MSRRGLALVCILALFSLAAPGSALSVAFTAAPNPVENPGATLGPLAWTVSDAAAVVTAAWSPLNTKLGAWNITREPAASAGTLSLAIPATAPPGTYTFVLKAVLGSITATSTHQLRINKAPTLQTPVAIITKTVLEDVGLTNFQVKFTADDDLHAHPYSFSLLNPTGMAVVTVLDSNADPVTAVLAITTAPNQFTVNPNLPGVPNVPCTVTLRATDIDGGVTDVPIAITVTNVNDAPVIAVQPGADDPVPHDPSVGALQPIDPLFGGLPAFAPSEPLDLDPTRTRAGATSTYLRWRFQVAGGVDGGDLLKPVGDGVTWQVVNTAIQRKVGTTWTTVATWNRSANGTLVTNRSDHLTITLNAYADASRGDVTAILQLVHYAWLLGTQSQDSPYLTRSLQIACDEPHGTAAGVWDTATLTRTIALRPPNRAPLVSGLALEAVPLGETELHLAILDDGNAPGCDTVAEVTLALVDGGSPSGGRLSHRDAPDVALAPGTTFTVAELAAGKIVYAHQEATVTEDRLGLRVSDGDQSVVVTVAITIAMDKARLGILSDPLLVLRRPDGGAATWQLRFTHALSSAPTLAPYPGLPAPTGVTVGGDAVQGWHLAFNWPSLPLARGYVAFVVLAQTDAASATLATTARQAMLVRLPDAVVASPPASNN